MVGIAYGCPYYTGPAIFYLFFKVPQVKNRLFPTNPLPQCKLLTFVQSANSLVEGLSNTTKSFVSQESCPTGEYLHSEQLWMLEKVSAALKTTPTTIPQTPHISKNPQKKEKHHWRL